MLDSIDQRLSTTTSQQSLGIRQIGTIVQQLGGSFALQVTALAQQQEDPAAAKAAAAMIKQVDSMSSQVQSMMLELDGNLSSPMLAYAEVPSMSMDSPQFAAGNDSVLAMMKQLFTIANSLALMKAEIIMLMTVQPNMQQVMMAQQPI
jgi:hypothetical protein